MYESHPLLQEPTPETCLWRYMDLAKFLALLERKAIHLAALRTFDDPFEGHPPRSAIEPMTVKPDDMNPEVLSRRRATIEHNLQAFQSSRTSVFASCWHMNGEESAGMWSQYIKSGEGLAIRTTFERLRRSICPTGPAVSGAVVQYIDFDTHPTTEYNVVAWGVLKRASFSHEREFRLVSLQPSGPTGIHVQIHAQDLIEQVYVAPTTPDWMFELIKNLLSRYELDTHVVRSELNQGPKYMVLPQWARDAQPLTQADPLRHAL
jgi:hypothetical protein